MKIRSLVSVLLFFLAGSSVAATINPVKDFEVRGFHLDMRIQVMKMPALKKFALGLSKKGINTLIMEWEGTYPYLSEPLISNRFAYSRKEVKDFIAYCQGLNIDVIPLQQSFGHVEYILRNNRYAALREDDKDLSQVCPSELELDKKLFTRLYTDMAAMHPSPYIHIGGDETHLLGHCEKCKKRAAEIGISRLYFDYIKMLCDIVVGLGKRPVLWADIALKYPEYIHLLPKETVFVDWNYGWQPDRFGNHEKLIQSGYEIWGAAAIRSSPDNYYLTRWQYHFNNIRDFIPFCKNSGYKGIIMTSWSTSGVYSSVYESEDDLVDLVALRHVYPIGGFNILILAYEKSITLTDTLNVNKFIATYCNTHFGFSKQQSISFQKALFTAPYTISNGKVDGPGKITIKALLDSVKTATAILRALKPTKNAGEFAHFRLMADIRFFYVSFLQIENEVNISVLSTKTVHNYLSRLEVLKKEESNLNGRFNTLNRDMLYPAAIAEENNLRNQKINNLYNRLARVK